MTAPSPVPAPYRHVDGRTLCLGMNPGTYDPQTLRMEKYISTLPEPPAAVNWYGNVVNWGAMLNDALGDCTCAAYGHGAQVVTLNTPVGEITPPDDLVLHLYEEACGYVPGDPSTDNGGIINQVLKYARVHALGHKDDPFFHRKFPLYAYAWIDTSAITVIKQAINLFAAVDIGLNLPLTAQAQVGSVWDVVGDPQTDPNSFPNSWGGHSVIVAAYDSNGPTCITWGQLQPMTWRFWNTYVTQSYCLLYEAWLDRVRAAGQAGVLAQLESDLAALTAAG